MLDKIFAALKDDINPIEHMSSIISTVASLATYFTEDYVKDKDSKNAAIDAICEMLQTYKDK